VKVLLAAHRPGLTGAERDLLELADSLSSQEGVSVEAVVPGSGALVDALDARRVPTTVVPYRWWASRRAVAPRLAAWLALYPTSVARATRLVEQSRPDLVVTFTLAIPVWAAAARRTRVPHIWMAREYMIEDHGLHFFLGRARSMRFVEQSSVLVAVPSRAVAARLAEWIPPAKLRVLRYAAAQPASVPVAAKRSEAFEMLAVGTLSESKGQHAAIEALARLRRAGVPAELTVVGAGRRGYTRRLERLTHSLGVADAVAFRGAVADVTPFYDAADVLVLSSRSEAYGRVVIEAMKRGLPVVGTRSGGTVEQIEESEGGLLYEPGDIDGLTAALRRLHDDGALRRDLGANGKVWANATFTAQRYADEFLLLAAEAIQTARANQA